VEQLEAKAAGADGLSRRLMPSVWRGSAENASRVLKSRSISGAQSRDKLRGGAEAEQVT
jgi:hypothetical protein